MVTKEGNKMKPLQIWGEIGHIDCKALRQRCQQEHPRAWVWDCDALPLDDFRFTSTMSSCFAEESVSIPGKAAAIFRNSACTKKVHVTKEFHDQDNYNLVSIQ